MKITPIRTRLFALHDDLVAFVKEHIPNLKDRSVLVVTSKIVSLSEGRVEKLQNKETKSRLVKRESEFSFPTKWVTFSYGNGLALANAGIDESNSGNMLLLLPKDSYRSAARLRTQLMKEYGVTHLAVLITDTSIVPLRAGAIAMAIGYAGMKGLRDYRGKKDLYGRLFRFERVGVADGLATAAMMCMGDGNERQPLAVIEEAPVEFSQTVRRSELIMPLKDDMFLPFLGKIPKRLLRSHKKR